MPGDANVHLSTDTVDHEDDVTLYPSEFLNSINPSGFPPHKLTLKIGAPVQIVRNLDPPKLCNGTKLMVHKLHKVIEGIIVEGKYRWEGVFVPRIPLYTSADANFPIKFKQLQFPLKAAFASTIYKSQGNILNIFTGYLENDVFACGQLYVLLSRVASKKKVKIYTPDTKQTTKNIVYKEVFLM